MGAIKREERIGSQRLILGDCLEVMKELGRFDAVVTDPPYGISWTRGINRARGSKAHKGILNDQNTEVRDYALSIFGNGPAVVFGSFYAKFPDNIKQICVWQKPPDSGLVGSVTGFRRDAEPIFLCGEWPKRNCERSSIFRTTQGQSGIVSETGHPHTKPVSLMIEIISMISGKILDPFMGSGTTLVACQRMGRQGTGIELDPEYFDIACRRVEEATRQPDMFIAAPEPVYKQEGLF